MNPLNDESKAIDLRPIDSRDGLTTALLDHDHGKGGDGKQNIGRLVWGSGVLAARRGKRD